MRSRTKWNSVCVLAEESNFCFLFTFLFTTHTNLYKRPDPKFMLLENGQADFFGFSNKFLVLDEMVNNNFLIEKNSGKNFWKIKMRCYHWLPTQSLSFYEMVKLIFFWFSNKFFWLDKMANNNFLIEKSTEKKFG